MLRSILGGIAGYIVTFISLFILLTAVYFALGTEAAFQPGSYQVSMLWIGVSTVIGLLAAIVGGYVASLAGGGFGGAKALAVIILIMGVVMVVMIAVSPVPPAARPAELSNMEAMASAQTPLWAAILNPVIGTIGAMIGGRLRKTT